MKISLLAAIGLGVGLLGGSAVGAMRTKKVLIAERDSVAAAEAQHADSTGVEADASHTADLPDESAHAATAAATGKHPPEPAKDAAAEHGAGEGDKKPAPEAEAGGATASTTPPEPTRTAAGAEKEKDSTSALDPDGAKKLAKIFSAMKAPAAAAVLVEMSDDEVTAILLRMSDRQAGPIVGAFPPDRAAVLGRVVLRGQEGGS